MILDGFLLFTGQSNGATGGISNSGNTDSPTTGTQNASNIIDLGVTSGVPSSANGGGARDMGAGTPPLRLLIQVTTAFAGGTNMYCILAGAPDNGSGSPGSYTTMFTSPTVVEANLIAGARIANDDVPMVVPGQALPRFLRLSFVTSGTHTAGAVIGTIVLTRNDQPGSQTGTLSGYPAGITVAN